MKINRVEPEEAYQVIDLFDAYRVFYGKPSDRDKAAAFINERLQNNESVIFVAFDENNIPVGFTQLYPKYSSVRMVKNWILNDLYVAPGSRKQGIATALIKIAMHFAKNSNANFVQLETAVDNYTAQRLYESIGFEQQSADTAFILYKITI